MTRRSYTNNAAPLALSAGIDDNDTSVATGDNSAYPDPPFIAALERGTVDEEVVLVTAVPDTTHFTIERGYDGTTAKAHDSATLIEHAVSAMDYDEANAHVNDPDGLAGGDGHTNLVNRQEFATLGSVLAGDGAGDVVEVAPTANGQALISDDTEPGGARWGAQDEIVTFGKEGTLAIGAGKGRLYWPFAVEVLGVRAAVNTAPTGSSAIIDANKNGTTIYTTQANRPSITSGANSSSETVPDEAARSFTAGQYLTVDVDQIGSTVAGSDLTVIVRYRKV